MCKVGDKVDICHRWIDLPMFELTPGGRVSQSAQTQV